MKAQALLALPLAFLSFHSIPAKAADDTFSSLPELTRTDLQQIADRLATLANSGALQAVAGQAGGAGDSELDMQFVQKALATLGDMLSSEETRALLADVQRNPDEVLQQLLQMQGAGEEDDLLQAIVLYFLSLRRVLKGNEYLRNQVTSLIQQNADRLLSEGGFTEVLGEIANSGVFQDLKEEVEEDMQHKSGYLPTNDVADDMSR